VQRGHPSADGIPVIAETLTFGYRPQRPAGTPTHLTRLVAAIPSFSKKPISRAISSTRTISPSISRRNRRRTVAIVSWSGCPFAVMNRNATGLKTPPRIAVHQQPNRRMVRVSEPQ
jgi:hypothetical protein